MEKTNLLNPTNLLNAIDKKQMELTNLQAQYDIMMEVEKRKVLSSKTKGMEKTQYLLLQEFESSSQQTPQYSEFHRVFKREFTALLKPFCSEILISKPNHFDVTGFFKTNTGKIYYFSLCDLRWTKKRILIRTAKHFKDYTGGSNGFIATNNIEKNIKPYLV